MKTSVLSQINDEASNKTIKFNKRSLNKLLFTNPFVSFERSLKRNSINKNFDLGLSKENIDKCFEEDENVNYRTLYFKGSEHKNLFTMKDIDRLNCLDTNINKDLLNCLKMKSINEIVNMYLNSLVDNSQEKLRLEKLTKMSNNNDLKLQLEAKELYLLADYIEKQYNIECRGAFIINFLYESFARGNDDAFFKLVFFADLMNRELTEDSINKMSNNPQLEEAWFTKLLAQHVLAVIYCYGIRLVKPNKMRAIELFENVINFYLKIKEQDENTICKIPQAIICYLILKCGNNIYEYCKEYHGVLLKKGMDDNNIWCLYKIFKLKQQDYCYTGVDVDTSLLQNKENELFIYNSLKTGEKDIENNLKHLCPKGYAEIFLQLQTIYKEENNADLSNFCRDMYNKYKNCCNSEMEKYNFYASFTDFNELLVDFPLNPIVVNAIPTHIESQVKEGLETLMNNFNEIKLYLIMKPLLDKFSNEWNTFIGTENVLKNFNEPNNYLLLKQLLKGNQQCVNCLLTAKDLNENEKELFYTCLQNDKVSFVAPPTVRDNFISEIKTDLTDQSCYCKEHPKLQLDCICHTCDDLIVCSACCVKYHCKNNHHCENVDEKLIETEKKNILKLKTNLEFLKQTLQSTLQTVEQTKLKIKNQIETELDEVNKYYNEIVAIIQTIRDTKNKNIKAVLDKRLTSLTSDSDKLNQNIEIIQKAMSSTFNDKIIINLFNKRKELAELESHNSIHSLPSLQKDSVYKFVLNHEEKEIFKEINRLSKIANNNITINISLCTFEDIPNVFIENENYKLKLLLKGDGGNISSGGYLIKSFLFNEENKIDDCFVTDNQNGSYFIEFKCPSVLSFKLKTFIEGTEMKIYDLKVTPKQVINTTTSVSNLKVVNNGINNLKGESIIKDTVHETSLCCLQKTDFLKTKFIISNNVCNLICNQLVSNLSRNNRLLLENISLPISQLSTSKSIATEEVKFEKESRISVDFADNIFKFFNINSTLFTNQNYITKLNRKNLFQNLLFSSINHSNIELPSVNRNKEDTNKFKETFNNQNYSLVVFNENNTVESYNDDLLKNFKLIKDKVMKHNIFNSFIYFPINFSNLKLPKQFTYLKKLECLHKSDNEISKPKIEILSLNNVEQTIKSHNKNNLQFPHTKRNKSITKNKLRYKKKLESLRKEKTNITKNLEKLQQLKNKTDNNLKKIFEREISKYIYPPKLYKKNKKFKCEKVESSKIEISVDGIMSSFILIQRIIGSGTEGVVSLFHCKNRFYAIKEYRDSENDEFERMLKFNGHPNVVKVKCTLLDQNQGYIMEYVKNGSLNDEIKKVKEFEIGYIIKFLLQMLNFLILSHKENISHRDLKPDNILVKKDINFNLFKVTDFGHTDQLDKNSIKNNSICGSHCYMSPEMIKGRHNVKVDIWSLGCILYQLITSNNPPNWYDLKDLEEIQKVLDPMLEEVRIKLEQLLPQKEYQNLKDELNDLIKSMLEVDYKKRIEAKDILPKYLNITKYFIHNSLKISLQDIDTEIIKEIIDKIIGEIMKTEIK